MKRSNGCESGWPGSWEWVPDFVCVVGVGGSSHYEEAVRISKEGLDFPYRWKFGLQGLGGGFPGEWLRNFALDPLKESQ